MSTTREEIEEELANLRSNYYNEVDKAEDEALLGFMGGLVGAGVSGEVFRRRLKKRKAKKQARLEAEAPAAKKASVDDLSVKSLDVQGVPKTFRPRSFGSRAWGGVKKLGGGVGKAAGFISIPMILMRQQSMPVYNPKFGEQINGRYFDYKKAAGKWTWLLIAIDTILSFAPYLNIISTILDLTDLGASTIEGAVGDENRTVSKYVDWVTAVERLLVNIAYEDWKKEMKNTGKSQWTADFSDIQKSFEQDRYAVSPDELLPDDWVKDRKDGKISDKLWNVLTKLARGETAQKQIRELSDKEWKQLTEDYQIDTTKTSFINDTEGQIFDRLYKKVQKYVVDNEPAPVWTRAGAWYYSNAVDDIDQFIKEEGAEEAYETFFKGESWTITWNNQQFKLNGRQGFILYMIIQGDDSYLRNANQETKDFFKNELGVMPFEEGQTEISVASTGEVAEEFYRKGQMKQKEAIEPMWEKVEHKLKGIRPGAFKKIEQMEQKAVNPDFADPNQELQYIYDTRINLLHGYEEQITNAKLNSDDPSRGGNTYTETWLKGFYNPETDTKYLFKDPVDAKYFWNDPGKYAAEFGDKIYVNAQGRGYQEMSSYDKDEQEEYEKGLEKLAGARQKEIDLYTQDKKPNAFVRKAGASLAGGAPVTGQYVSGGRASMAGGMRVQPSKK